MLVHHDARKYEVAVSEAALKFQHRLEEQIGGSVQRVTAVVEQVQNDVPDDQVIRGAALAFALKDGDTIAVEGLGIHEHALNQIAYRSGVKNLSTVVRELAGRGDWGRKLVVDTLNEVYAHGSLKDRFLLRSVRGQLRGFLSDSYRRLDSRPLMDAFIGAIRKFGARPIDGFALTTKTKLRAILPYVFEPVPGEIMAFGAELSDSDYGDGKLAFSAFMRRLWCTNDAVTEDVLAQVHLGRRLDERIEFSQQTLELDTRTMASAIDDVAGGVLSPDGINRQLNIIRKAAEEKVEPAAMNTWIKKNLTKDEGLKAATKFNSPDVEMLPKGNTAWRFSNAISWLANETEDETRKLALQDLAGGLILPKAA